MPKPTSDPRWATAAGVGRAVDPGASLRASGWPQDSPLPSANYNWQLQTDGEWIVYITTGIDPTDGWAYDPACDFIWDFNPVDGGFIEIDAAGAQAVGGVTIETAASPPYVHITVGGGPDVVFRIPWRPRFAANASKPADAAVLNSIVTRCKGTGTGSSTIVIDLYKTDFTGGGTPATLVRSFSPTLNASFSTETDGSLAIAIDEASTYWFEITMNSSGGGSPTDTGIAALYCFVSKVRVE